MFEIAVNNLLHRRRLRWLVLPLSILPGFLAVQAASDEAQVVAVDDPVERGPEQRDPDHHPRPGEAEP